MDFECKSTSLQSSSLSVLPFVSISISFFAESDSSLWNTLLTLRDHNSERRALNPDLWDKHDVPVAVFVAKVCKMAPNEDFVLKIMGILATNSANLDLEEGFGQACALYGAFAKINHRYVISTQRMPTYYWQFHGTVM